MFVIPPISNQYVYEEDFLDELSLVGKEVFNMVDALLTKDEETINNMKSIKLYSHTLFERTTACHCGYYILLGCFPNENAAHTPFPLIEQSLGLWGD